MIAFNLGKKGGIIQRACERSVKCVIITLLKVKGHPTSDAIIAWVKRMTIQIPKIAVIIPAINFPIITSFLYHHIHAFRPLLTTMLAQSLLAVKCKTTQPAMNMEVI